MKVRTIDWYSILTVKDQEASYYEGYYSHQKITSQDAYIASKQTEQLSEEGASTTYITNLKQK